MSKIAYVGRKFSVSSMELIQHANTIIDDYLAQGYVLTVRQLYYQFVARGLIENTVKQYKRLGSVINDARLAGQLDWESIEDRTRGVVQQSHWDNPGDILLSAAQSYRLDKWQGQPCRVECWVEKEALAGVFDRVCKEMDVPLLSCRGYTSQSEMWRASNRMISYSDQDQAPVILHFGDHDPSGIDMTRDIQDRLRIFGVDIELRRLALNMDQVESYKPPPNPAKETDSRFVGYLRQYGDESWELDALDPSILSGLVKREIEGLIDQSLWAEIENKERNDRWEIEDLAARWEDGERK